MSFLQKVVNKFNSEKSFTFNEVDPFGDVNNWVSTGNPSLDLHLKTFGWPTGVIEVRGESQSGKTTISLQAMKSCLEGYGERAVVCILSSERRDNKPYATQMGLDTNRILIHRVKTIEDVQNKIFQTIANTKEALKEHIAEQASEKHKKDSAGYTEAVKTLTEKFGKLRYFFVWDALGQTVSSQELEKAKDNAAKDEQGKAALSSAARSLSGLLRVVKGLEDEEHITLMIINRPYDKIDGTPGKKSYGGKAIELFPTMRIELSRIQGVKILDDEVGQITQFATLKTDFDRPKQKFNFEIAYGMGIVLGADDIALGIEKGVLEKFGVGGAKFNLGAKSIQWKSRKELYALYLERNPTLNILIKKLTKLAHEQVKQTRTT